MSLSPTTPQRTAQGTQTVERVLDAAERLFAERGFEGTGLREVARAAGLRAPSLYNHFPNKEALYEAVLERALQPMRSLLVEFLAEGREAYRDPRLAHDMMQLLQRRPNIARLLHHEALAGGRQMNSHLKGWLRSFLEGGLEAMRGGPSNDIWSDDELPLLFFALSTAFTGYFSLGPGFAEPFGADPLSDDAIRRQTLFIDKLWRVIWGGAEPAPSSDLPDSLRSPEPPSNPPISPPRKETRS